MTTGDGKGPELPGPATQARPGWRPGDDLWPLEVDMVDRATAGEPLDLGEGPLDPDVMLEVMNAWGPERTIRAAVLRHVLSTSISVCMPRACTSSGYGSAGAWIWKG